MWRMRTFVEVVLGVALAGLTTSCGMASTVGPPTSCTLTEAGFTACLVNGQGDGCPSDSTPVQSCATANQIGSCTGSQAYHTGAAYFYATTGLTASDAQLVCFGLQGTWADAPPAVDGGTSEGLACDAKMGTQERCFYSSGQTGAALCATMSGVSTTVISTCPTANTVGSCVFQQAGKPVTKVYYSGGDTLATAQADCASSTQGAWVVN